MDLQILKKTPGDISIIFGKVGNFWGKFDTIMPYLDKII